MAKGALVGRKVAFTPGASATDGYLAVPAAGTGPGLLVVGRTAGLTGHVSSIVDRLAAEGFVAYAPDLFHPSASTGDAAVALPSLVEDLVAAADRFDGEHAGELGIVGFGPGGTLALAAAAGIGAASAVVSFYPELDGLAEVPWSRFRHKSTVIHQAGQKDALTAVQRRINESGGSVRVYDYADAEPDFFNDDRPESYHPDAARTAWARTLELFRGRLVAAAA
jgi:carboxymethylenebutenolidase